MTAAAVASGGGRGGGAALADAVVVSDLILSEHDDGTHQQAALPTATHCELTDCLARDAQQVGSLL